MVGGRRYSLGVNMVISLIIKVLGYGRTGGAGHFHEPGIVTGHEEGGVEQLVDFGKLVEFGGVADLPFHLPDDGSEGFHVRLGPERQGFGDARPFEDTRDDVAVVDFLSGHLLTCLPFCGSEVISPPERALAALPGWGLG